MTKQIIEPNNMNKDLAWILGVMCGDGCLDKQRNDRRVSLSTIDSKFGRTFVDRINKLFNLNEKFNPKLFVNNTNSKYYKVQIHSKHLYNFFMKFGKFNCFEWTVPEQIVKGNKILKRNFLRGFYDSEGSIIIYRKKYRRIRAVSVNKNGLEGIWKLLDDLGIKINLIKEKNCYSLNIYKKDQINFFNKSIGFSFKNAG